MSRQLRLVARAQQQAGEDHREAAGEHHGVEIGNISEIDAEILRRRTADLADEIPEIAGELRVLDQQVRAGDFLLGPLHELPDALLVLVRGPVAWPHQRHHVAGAHPRLRDARAQRGCGDTAADQQRAAAHFKAAHAH
jgi:hypothetical protein